MDTLLAYRGPLRHVDHSHRQTVPTGRLTFDPDTGEPSYGLMDAVSPVPPAFPGDVLQTKTATELQQLRDAAMERQVELAILTNQEVDKVNKIDAEIARRREIAHSY